MKKGMLVLFISILLVLVGCSGDSIESESSETAGDDNTVSIWYYYSGKQQELFNKLIEEYNESQDQYQLEGEYIPFGDTKKQLSVGSAGDTLPDMVIIDVVDNAAFAAQGVFEDITEKVEEWGEADKLYEGPLESATYDGRYYGLPVGSNALGLFYNEDLFEEAGIDSVPETWDELKEVAEKLSTNETKGFAVSAVKSEEATFQFYPFLRSADAEYDSLNSDGAEDALTFLKGLIDQGFMGSDIINATQDDLARQFATGQVAMMVNGPWNIERLKDENPDLNFGIGEIPRDKEFASALGGENIAIIKDSNVDGAFDFVTWLLEPERIEEFSAETGVFPPREDVLKNSDFWNDDKHLSGFVPIMDYAGPRGPSPEWPTISEAIQIALQEALTGTKSPEDALTDAAEKVEQAINND
ncbi:MULTISPECIES: ABC transporter substrate-binding protein [unclassified Oceanobacillus]|uniref:ABC transporter substrate-binding protein n=1 Tax=unclassified Oceanobacillus TaxID=2630292 RepID=UPI00300DCCA3